MYIFLIFYMCMWVFEKKVEPLSLPAEEKPPEKGVVLNFADDILFTNKNSDHRVNQEQGHSRNFYGIDKNYRTVTINNFHNKWGRSRLIKWRFDCDSVRILPDQSIKTLCVDTKVNRFGITKLRGKYVCMGMERLINEALDEWMMHVSQSLEHRMAYDNELFDEEVVVISFERPNVFSKKTTLAHANGDQLQINIDFDWVILGARNPTYFLMLDENQFNFEDGKFYRSSKHLFRQFQNTNIINLYTVVLHEMGHVLGFLHANAPTSIMYATSLFPINWVQSADSSFIAQMFQSDDQLGH